MSSSNTEGMKETHVSIFVYTRKGPQNCRKRFNHLWCDSRYRFHASVLAVEELCSTPVLCPPSPPNKSQYLLLQLGAQMELELPTSEMPRDFQPLYAKPAWPAFHWMGSRADLLVHSRLLPCSHLKPRPHCWSTHHSSFASVFWKKRICQGRIST